MKTHRERANDAAQILLLDRTAMYQNLETGEEVTAAELIARQTYPAELVKAASALVPSEGQVIGLTELAAEAAGLFLAEVDRRRLDVHVRAHGRGVEAAALLEEER